VEPLALAIDHLREGVFLVGSDWTFVYVNDAGARHGQGRREELVGRTVLECYPGIEATPIFAGLKRVMDGGDAVTMRGMPYTFPTGETRRFDLIVQPVPGGILIITADVTAELQREASRRESDERTHFAMRAARMGVWQMTLATGEVYLSDTLSELLGVPVDAQPQTIERFLSLIDPSDRDHVAAAIAHMASGSDADVVEQFRILPPLGPRRWAETHGRLIRNAEGQPERIIGVALDITERRNTEWQLQQSLKMEAIGRLAGGIAHDFNNQLTAILGFCDVLARHQGLDEAGRSDLDEIRNAGERAAALTRQLLAFGRRQVLALEPLDLNELTGHVSRLLGRLLGENIQTRFEVASRPCVIQGDANQIENVLTNLAINARDAMPHGGTLTLGTSVVDITPADVVQRPDMTTGRYVVLSFSDTGHGMDEATRARIFEPFFTTKAPGVGTGLGLSTVYGIVKQMHGFIWVYSEPNAGTTFRLYFPEAERPAAIAGGPGRAGGVTSRDQGATILVVEDQPAVRDFAVRVLRKHGYDVLEAGSAEEAASVLERRGAAVDLLLLDVMLPERSGPELFSSLTRPPRVLYMSGYPDRHVRELGIGGGFRLLEKPFTIADLLAKVRDVLQSPVPVERRS